MDVQATTSRLRELTSLQKAYAEARDLCQNITILEEALSNDPSHSYSSPSNDTDANLQAFVTVLKQGKIPRNDNIYKVKTTLMA